MGWLLDGVASGRIPPPSGLWLQAQATISLGLALRQMRAASHRNACTPLDGREVHRLQRGEWLDVTGDPARVELVVDGSVSDPVVFRPAGGERLEAIAGPLDLRIGPGASGSRAALCR